MISKKDFNKVYVVVCGCEDVDKNFSMTIFATLDLAEKYVKINSKETKRKLKCYEIEEQYINLEIIKSKPRI